MSIDGTFWDQNHTSLSAKRWGGSWAFVAPFEIKITIDYGQKKSKKIRGTFGDQNHFWFSAKKVEKMLDFHFLGSKSHLIIGPNIIVAYREEKNLLSRGGGTFWDKNYTWLSAKKLEIMLHTYYRRILRRKNEFRGRGLSLCFCGTIWDQNHTWLSAGGGSLCICGILWVQNHTWLSAKKSRNMLKIIAAF